MERNSSRPPTLNFLGPFQRSRLLKSSRKIEYIFGTTPHVLESSDFPHRSYDLVDGHAPDSILRKLKSKNHRSARLHLSPLSGTDDSSTNDHRGGPHLQTLGTHTTNLPSPLPLTVSTPHPPALLRTFTEPPDHHEGTVTSADRLYRKQMAKLTRMLGENIPPELVRGQNSRHTHPLQSDPIPMSRQRLNDGDNTSRHPRRSGRRSSSYPPSPIQQPRPVSSSISPPPAPPNLAFATSPSLPPPLSVPASSSQGFHATRGEEGMSPSTSPGSLEGSNGSSNGSGRSPSQSITYPLLASDQRWNGEWNVKNTETRATALRNLSR